MTKELAAPYPLPGSASTASTSERLSALGEGYPGRMWRRSILQSYIDNPRYAVDLYAAHCDQFVLIKDKYPKAQVHYLVLPRTEPIPVSIHSLVSSDVEMLLGMRRFATTELLRSGVDSRNLRFGFHLKPSLEPLHMHIISPDLSQVKRKDHWWSFTDGFISFDDVVDILERGEVSELQQFITMKIDSLTCDKCTSEFKNLRDLKMHRVTHIKAKPLHD